MAHQRTLPQSKEALLKSYTSRLKDDVKSMLENFEGKSFFWLTISQLIKKVPDFFNIFRKNYLMNE